MESKSTLELYRGNKRGISAECFYDNSIGSSLLFEARAGALRTLVYRSRFQDTGMCTKCRLCGAEAETQEHLILRCAGLQTAPAEDTDLPRALGFHMLEAEDRNHIANGRNVGRTCAITVSIRDLRMAECYEKLGKGEGKGDGKARKEMDKASDMRMMHAVKAR
ncbi:hypothetical protein HPB49_019474 [Dermacentor silvarum]|uniref:Uncharacterized protein n=1 Tax=Dermacentor silvarum TaxID=543639 RepID=A0ACB8E2K4_DERSI|nr:hypothetical protein HPB49_019474 [Dermacentor silvarum]